MAEREEEGGCERERKTEKDKRGGGDNKSNGVFSQSVSSVMVSSVRLCLRGGEDNKSKSQCAEVCLCICEKLTNKIEKEKGRETKNREGYREKLRAGNLMTDERVGQ